MRRSNEILTSLALDSVQGSLGIVLGLGSLELGLTLVVPLLSVLGELGRLGRSSNSLVLDDMKRMSRESTSVVVESNNVARLTACSMADPSICSPVPTTDWICPFNWEGVVLSAIVLVCKSCLECCLECSVCVCMCVLNRETRAVVATCQCHPFIYPPDLSRLSGKHWLLLLLLLRHSPARPTFYFRS